MCARCEKPIKDSETRIENEKEENNTKKTMQNRLTNINLFGASFITKRIKISGIWPSQANASINKMYRNHDMQQHTKKHGTRNIFKKYINFCKDDPVL